MENCGRQKVSIKFFRRSETQTKIFGHHGLAGKHLQSMSSGIKPALKSSFDHFDRSTFPLFDAQRISKSSPNFFADVPSPLCNKLRKDFRTSLDTTSPGSWRKNAHGFLRPQCVCYGIPLKKHGSKASH